MKKATLLLLLIIPIIGIGQKVYKLKKNQTAIVSTKILLLDTLILDDNSTLKIANAVQAFKIIAKYALIGNNVTIEGSKELIDTANQNGTNGLPVTIDCKKGNNGENGKKGIDGQSATDIFLYVRIFSLGSLNINCSGTRAGNGGDGGNGSKGANAKVLSCAAQPGGKGGNGGNGGDAGNGGTVIFNYTFIDDFGNYLNNQPTISKVSFNLSGGIGGNGGRRGQKGEAGNKLPGSTTDPNKYVEDSKQGLTGLNGKNGYSQTIAVKQNF